MSRSVLYMSMSLDGYIAGPNDHPGNPGGDDFMRLHDWYGFAAAPGPEMESVDPSRIGQRFLEEMKSTGAVLAGRNTVEQVDHWLGNHHDSVPIFVPSHRAQTVGHKLPVGDIRERWHRQPRWSRQGGSTDRDVLVHGGYTARSALEAGVLDEIQIHQIPVLFGAGSRLFDFLPKRIELTIVRVMDLQ